MTVISSVHHHSPGSPKFWLGGLHVRFYINARLQTPFPPFARATPLSEQQQMLFPQLLEPWNRLAVPFSGGP